VPTVADVTSVLNTTSSEPRYGVGYSVQQTRDGGYIITGTRYSDEIKFLSQMVWLIKTDANGDKVWDRTFGGLGNTVGYSVQQTNDGGYIIGGSKVLEAGITGEIWVIKTDSNGTEFWDKSFDGSGDDAGKSVQQTSDGGYIIKGSTCPHGVGGKNSAVWLIKTDKNGNKVWDRTLS
jgi:hypothetical protein